MHHNHFEAIQTVQKLAFLLGKDDYDAVDVSVHPPFTDLRSVQITLADQKATDINLGAQNCHWEDKGAFTGEISPRFLAKLDCTYVIAGHSERRQLFGETDEMVHKKVQAILRHEMTPILCAGRPSRSGRRARPRRRWSARSSAASPGSRPSRSRASWSPTSPSGPSARAAPRRRTTRRPCAR